MMDYSYIVKNFKTPLYIFNIDELIKRTRYLKEVFQCGIVYAVKANTFIPKEIEDEVERFEICSSGEFEICNKLGINHKKMVISGVNKDKHFIDYLISNFDDILKYTIESYNQYVLLNELSNKYNKKIHVLIILTSGNQFGVSEEDFIKIIQENNNLIIDGIEYFSGTQKHSLTIIEKELDHLNDFINEIENNYNFKIVYCNYINEELEYEIIDDETLKENFALTEKLPDGYKEINNTNEITIFTNMDTFNNIEEKINIHPKGINQQNIWKHFGNTSNSGNRVKIKCENIIDFSNYIENIIQTQNIDIFANYYSLENQEKIIYTNILELILRTIILTIIIIGIISSINIINASLCEREEEFKALSRLGATKGNIIKILIYENIYMFIKATIISIILSIPILYKIIKYMEKTIILDKILIPFTNIAIFILLLFIISLIIAIYSAKFIKEE